MDPKLWSKLPADIIDRVCFESVKMRGSHPFAEEIKTLVTIYDIIKTYCDFYGEDEGLTWLGIDLEEQFFNPKSVLEGWGVHKKWKSLTPTQRREFFTVLV